MICNTCKKLIVNKIGKERCAVLRTDKLTSNQDERLPIWGENCSAYTDDPEWEKKVKEAAKKYSARE